jgi:hypothetical protein
MEKASSAIWGAALLSTAGIYMTASGWWLWRSSGSINPESHFYRLYKANYYAFAWLFSPNRRFEEMPERYFKHWAKRMLVFGAFSVALSIVVGVWALLQ